MRLSSRLALPLAAAVDLGRGPAMEETPPRQRHARADEVARLFMPEVEGTIRSLDEQNVSLWQQRPSSR